MRDAVAETHEVHHPGRVSSVTSDLEREMTAVDRTGRPTMLGCYLCTRDTGGDPHAPDSEHPQRTVVDSFTSGGSDPTEIYILECGHKII